MRAGWLGLPWWLWAAGAALVALVFTQVYPRSAVAAATGVGQRSALRWGHALVWALLASSLVLRAVLPGRAIPVANGVALAALAVYGWFVVSLVRA